MWGIFWIAEKTSSFPRRILLRGVSYLVCLFACLLACLLACFCVSNTILIYGSLNIFSPSYVNLQTTTVNHKAICHFNMFWFYKFTCKNHKSHLIEQTSQCPPTQITAQLRHHIVGQARLFPVQISPALLITTTSSQLFPIRDRLTLCEISGFYRGLAETFLLQGCYASYVGSGWPAFRDSLSVHLQGSSIQVFKCVVLKI